MDLATVDKLLTTTRSVRKRLDLSRPVEPEIIQACLEIAMQAPIGGNIPRYHFVVVTDAAKRADLALLGCGFLCDRTHNDGGWRGCGTVAFQRVVFTLTMSISHRR